MTTTFDVLGIGNAIVDIMAQTEEDFLVSHGMAKGSMTLIDEPRAEKIYGDMGPAVEISGGSAANTIAGIANLGGRAAFVGKVRDDALGQSFTHDIRAAGVTFTTPPASDGPTTARCFILVTPDGERTMNTYLGAAQDLHPRDIDEKLIASAAITYLEGYLWDPPNAKEAFRRAATIAHGAGRRVALTLSDSFCVGRYRAEFLDLMKSRTVDLVFANESELLALYETSDFEGALAQLRKDVALAAVSRSEKGCIIASSDGLIAQPAQPIDKLVDTTGAGDLFAAGFLFGHSRGADLKNCAELGTLAASEVIQHLGARPQTALPALAASKGIKVPV